MIELLFLLGFTLHNLEEAIWLPAWSKHASRFHPEVKRNEFHFAVLTVTIIGYLITFFHLVNSHAVVHYAFYGFILMMSLNVVFPHLVATIVLRRYSPGLLTGLFLNLPFGVFLIRDGLSKGIVLLYLFGSAMVLSAVFILLINMLFKTAGKIIDPY
ncbi:MAG: HXXEE domain-containing protein [Chloroflexi bacterium]|nr:HXXEE domain-containing protein [Chloroflexota bacterium]